MPNAGESAEGVCDEPGAQAKAPPEGGPGPAFLLEGAAVHNAQQQPALLLVQRPAQRVYALGEFRLGIQIDVTLLKKMIHKNYSF